MTPTSGSVYYHHDGLGNTIAITNGDAEVLERYSYDALGRVTFVDASTGNAIAQSAHGVRHFYTGHDFQAELGLYLTHYRAYEPALGRWLSADPIGENGGWNLYGYVSNNPVNYIDPHGLQGGSYNKRTGGSACPGKNSIQNPFNPDEYDPETMQDIGMAASLVGMAASATAIMTPAEAIGFGAGVVGAWSTMQSIKGTSRTSAPRAQQSDSNK
jgi:RHS repeat-associated protein